MSKYSIIEIIDCENKTYLKLLNPNYKKEFEELENKKRKNEFLTSRVLIEKLLSSITPSNAPVCKDHNNKPYFKDLNLKNKLNLSYAHSSSYLAAVISKSNAVGIDIEEVSRFKNHKAFNKWLSPEERNKICEHQDKDRELCKLWTKKEALCKATGLGYGLRFKDHHIFNQNKYPLNGKEYFFKTISADDYICTICSTSPTDFEFFKVFN